MEVFTNLGLAKALELYNKFIAQGMNEDDAFSEVYSIECNMDIDESEEEDND